MAITPNMNLTLPTVSQTTGPSWANQINTDLTVIDGHNHGPGSGVPIPSSGLNINDDVGFGTHSAVGLTSTQYVNQIAPTAGCAVYALNGELYYNDSSAYPIQITSNGSVVGPPGQWTNLAPPAVAGYGVGTGTFYFQSNALTFGTLQSAALTLISTTSSQPVSVTVSPSTATYTLTLPTVAPAQVGSLLSSSNTGSMSWVTAGATMSITSSTINVANNGITSTQISNNAITQTKLESKSAAYSALTNALTVNGPASTVVKQLATQNYVAGRPVYICLTGLFNDGSTPSAVSCSAVGSVYLYLLVTQPNSVNTHFSFTPLTTYSTALPTVCGMFNVAVTGSHTISLICYIPSSGSSLVINNVAIQAFQL